MTAFVGAERAIETDAESAGAAVGEDLAEVRGETVLRIFGGDAALDGVSPISRSCPAAGSAERFLMQLVALRDQDLAAHDVDAGDLLGDRVLHLDARIHLDEEPLAGLGIDEELDGAGVGVVHFLRDLHARRRRGRR